LVLFALTASFALLSWVSYADATGKASPQQQLAPAVHARR
jgi:hypothetical protein